jgi:predicted RNase H-like HicB family nuclease
VFAILYRNRGLSMSEIIFEVQEDEVDGGYVASALGYGIHTQGETLEELRTMVRDAVHCYFDETMLAPKVIRLRPSGAEAQS